MADYSHFPAAINKLSKPCDEDDQGSDIIRRARSSPRHPVSSAGTPSASGRKPRGRPPGSKNKPKPPVVITRDSEYEMQPVVLQLAAGSDVLGSITAFARRHRVGVSILGGSGAIANAALREPGSSAASFTISGRFDILCLSGSFLPPAADKGSAAAFTISLAGERGEVIGGAVAGPVRAAGPVMVVGVTFLAAEYYRLPAAREDEGGMEEDGDVKKFRFSLGLQGQGFSLIRIFKSLLCEGRRHACRRGNRQTGLIVVFSAFKGCGCALIPHANPAFYSVPTGEASPHARARASRNAAPPYVALLGPFGIPV
ncbi:hypothetical protein HPP92_013977 [Vanilla planifolia]|uniref:PPC domain-containing protein n=1 Tax=Vanilla planifolia TaxID=51239 RepID=A0A835QU32_VANPL|nr:hypothetical protein HPP92_013977 [Vanilla planifolia]